jgi:hypothetical protein
MFITFMEIDNNMYSFINHKSLSHLAIPFFYSVNNDNVNNDIIKNAEAKCLLHDPKCISDNLFDYFSKCETEKQEDKPIKKVIKKTKRDKKKHSKITRKNKK